MTMLRQCPLHADNLWVSLFCLVYDYATAVPSTGRYPVGMPVLLSL